MGRRGHGVALQASVLGLLSIPRKEPACPRQALTVRPAVFLPQVGKSRSTKGTLSQSGAEPEQRRSRTESGAEPRSRGLRTQCQGREAAPVSSRSAAEHPARGGCAKTGAGSQGSECPACSGAGRQWPHLGSDQRLKAGLEVVKPTVVEPRHLIQELLVLGLEVVPHRPQLFSGLRSKTPRSGLCGRPRRPLLGHGECWGREGVSRHLGLAATAPELGVHPHLSLLLVPGGVWPARAPSSPSPRTSPPWPATSCSPARPAPAVSPPC